MKTTLLTAAATVLVAGGLSAQALVGTTSELKHAVVEEFTGVQCGNCPAGHSTLDGIVAGNPDRIHTVGYNPTNSSYTNPGGTGATDFRRGYLDAFYTGSYCSPSSGSRFMPSAFINRKLGSNGDILQSRTIWSGMVDDVLLETSPVNIAVSSSYDATTQTATIDVEVYYVTDITESNRLYVHIMEDDLTSSYQSGSSATPSDPYVYKHTFREDLTGQWGDAIPAPRTAGTFYAKQFTFDFNTAQDPIDFAKASVIAFVIEDQTSTEVYTGIDAAIDGGYETTSEVDVTGISENNMSKVAIFPNPATDVFNINLSGIEGKVNLTVSSLLGQVVYTETVPAGTNLKQLDAKRLGLVAGSYFINVAAGNNMVTKKLIVK